MAQLDPGTQSLLDGVNFATVSTLREDGSIHGVVVWVGSRDGRVLVNTAEGRAWRKNLARDPRVSVTIPNAENPYEFATVSGRVVEEDHANGDADIDALAKKYLGADEYPFRQPGEVRVSLLIEPEKVSHRSAG